jgi:AcrR family transcriptional regulator
MDCALDRAVQEPTRLLDWAVQTASLQPMATTAKLTRKGAATRARIVASAADHILARGVSGTTLDDIRAGTTTSKGQLFHDFPGGKSDLVAAIAAFQSERVLDAQRPFLETLDSWEAWDGWRAAVIAHYGSQQHWGCPIGALTSELSGSDAQLAAQVAGYMERWRGYFEAGIARMRDAGLLRAGTDPARLALTVFAALHGGLLLTQSMHSTEPLEAALDGALAALRAAAPAG